VFWQKKWGILIKRESESLDFTGLEIPRDYKLIFGRNKMSYLDRAFKDGYQ